jgi:hypothetical protein
MKKILTTILAFFVGLNLVFGQSADPAVTGANFIPNQINVEQTSVLTVSFANTGSREIPINSIEITISTASNYYTTNGTTAPTGKGAEFFKWTYLGVSGISNIWRGSNKVAVAAFDGGDILLTVTGNTVSSGYENTNINVQPVDNLTKFNDSQVNNNLQPELKINQSCPIAPMLLATTKANICPLTTADLTTLQPLAVLGQTFEWHTVASNPIASTLVSSPSQALSGTYYLYAKAICYSPASSPATVTITVCTIPDITINVGLPTPFPIAAQISSIPVTVSNIGTATSVGPIKVVINIPLGTTFGTFPTDNNGWTCSTSGIVATCTSTTTIAPGSSTIFSVPFTSSATQVGNPLIILPAVVSGGGEVNTTNNTSQIIITAIEVGADLFPNFTFLSTTFAVGATKTVVININEVGNVSTNGKSIEFFIPNSTGFDYSFVQNSTIATGLGKDGADLAVNNSDWTMTAKTSGSLFTFLGKIPANGKSSIAIKVTAKTAGAEANLTANITPNGGGETNPFNNLASIAQSIQK